MNRRRLAIDIAGIGLAAMVGYLGFTALQRSGIVGGHSLALASEGRTIDSLSVFRPHGNDHLDSVRVDVRGSLIFIFAEGCAWCAEQMETWLELANQVDGKARVLAVSTAPTSSDHPFRRQGDVEYVGMARPAALQKRFAVQGVPSTVFVDTAGVVRIAVGGVLSRPDLKRLRRVVAHPDSM